MDRGAWRAVSPWDCKQSDVTERLTFSLSLFYPTPPVKSLFKFLLPSTASHATLSALFLGLSVIKFLAPLYTEVALLEVSSEILTAGSKPLLWGCLGLFRTLHYCPPWKCCRLLGSQEVALLGVLLSAWRYFPWRLLRLWLPWSLPLSHHLSLPYILHTEDLMCSAGSSITWEQSQPPSPIPSAFLKLWWQIPAWRPFGAGPLMSLLAFHKRHPPTVCVCVCVCTLSCFSCVWLFATLWTIACQAPLSMGFSRQERWTGLPCPPPGDLPDPGIKPGPLVSPALTGRFFTTSAAWEAPLAVYVCLIQLWGYHSLPQITSMAPSDSWVKWCSLSWAQDLCGQALG